MRWRRMILNFFFVFVKQKQKDDFVLGWMIYILAHNLAPPTF